MPRSGWFERRLLIALVLFSLLPTLIVASVGTMLLREAVSLQATQAGWERLGETGRELLEQAEAAGEPALAQAAERHRTELSASIQQAQRWGYINRRILEVLPWIVLAFIGTVAFLAVRWARRTAHAFASPISELVGWSGRIARGEPLPPPPSDGREESGEFAVLRESFRTMAQELEFSRERALEAARVRASVSLARAVAHELKNALTPLQLAVRALQADRALPPGAREPLEVIDAESQRLETLARAFSRLGRPPGGPLSPVDLVEVLEYLGRTHVPPAVRFELDAERESVMVNGYHDPLSRAFGNLILNAAEAMGDAGGVVRARIRPISGGNVEILIRDSGPGLPPGEVGRLWDPDFTTKPRGTGLGLALVRQTIHAHAGSIEAANRPEGGAEFRIVLPGVVQTAEGEKMTVFS